MKKVIIIILLISFFMPQIALADEIDPERTGQIIIGISRNLGLKSNVVEIKICQVKESSILPLEEEPVEPTEPVEPENPGNPEEPTEPAVPIEPTTPEEPTEPTEPEGPFRFKREFRGLSEIEETNDLKYFEAIQDYIIKNNIECDSYETNEAGKLILNNMPVGYYFIYVPKFRLENTIYVEQPVGVYLPTLNSEDEYEYDIAIYPKIDEDKTAKENYIPPELEVPETGTNKYLIPIFLGIGLLLIIIGRTLMYEKKDR